MKSFIPVVALKEKFLSCFSARATNAETLRETVRELTAQGVSRKTLNAWAVHAGYSGNYVSSLLSRIFCSLGLRARGVGGGRKTSPEVLELLAYVEARYGDKSNNLLRAAWRAARARHLAQKFRGKTTVIMDSIITQEAA